MIRRVDVTRIDPAQIATIRHLVGTAARTQYGPTAREIVEIVTKGSGNTFTVGVPLFILDGTVIPAELGRVLDATKIASVEVLKGAAAQAYGERARAGVVFVRSKVGSD